MTNNVPSPTGADFDGHAVSQTQCPCEDGRYSVRTSKFKTEGWGEGWQNQNHVNDSQEHRSDSEHTQSLQNRKDECFRMTKRLLPSGDD